MAAHMGSVEDAVAVATVAAVLVGTVPLAVGWPGAMVAILAAACLADGWGVQAAAAREEAVMAMARVSTPSKMRSLAPQRPLQRQ